MNKIFAIGNLGSDVSISETPNGTTIGSFPLAVNESWTDSGGEKRERTIWLKVTVFNQQARVCADYLKKGSSAFVEGRLGLETWTTQDGQFRAALAVTAQRVNFLEKGGAYLSFVVSGNLGREPEMRYTPSGSAVTNFSLAANRRWKDRDGNRQEETDWFDVSAWNGLAESCNQYLDKGSKVLVEAKPELERWTGNDGQERARVKLHPFSVEFLDSRRQGDEGPTQAASAGDAGYGNSYDGSADEVPW